MRLHWADTPETPWVEREGTNWETVSRPTTVLINGQTVIENLNVRDKVGTFHAYTREFKDIKPQNGIIELRFKSTPNHEAMIQAVEIIPEKNGDQSQVCPSIRKPAIMKARIDIRSSPAQVRLHPDRVVGGHRHHRDSGGDAVAGCFRGPGARPSEISCLNNLRQIGIFMQLYTDNHNDIFPGTPESGCQ